MIKDQLLSKNGTATMILSRELLKYAIGDRIPTITEFSKKMSLARGTVQNALKNLIGAKAIVVKPKGHLGSYLSDKNTATLMEYAGIGSLVGTMPLPYSKRYEGLASGIIISAEKQKIAEVNLAYMRGSKNRMSMVVNGRYHFAIVSRFAAKEYIENNGQLEIIMGFGPLSYLNKHVLMLHDETKDRVEDGMRIGVDDTSFDQKELTKIACGSRKVEYIPIEYTRTIEAIKNGEVDAMVMNIDEVLDKNVDIHYAAIEGYDIDNTEAVVLISKGREEIGFLLKEILDVDAVLQVQKEVMEGKLVPRY